MEFKNVIVSVDQIFPSGKTESTVLSNSLFYEEVPFDAVICSFKAQVDTWLLNEFSTGSDFDFHLIIKSKKEV